MNSSNTSVVVPTYNGRDKLPGILNALENQTIGGFEVVVVVDGSSDNTQQYLEEYQSRNFIFKVIYQENGGRAKVRNTGANVAVGKILIFYDDDMRPIKKSVEQHIDFHRQHQTAICGGDQLEDLSLAQNDFDKYRCRLRTIWGGGVSTVQELTKDNVHLTAANFSISKLTFDQLKGFRSTLTDHEDLDLARRASDQGIQVFFDPRNIGWHDDFISVRSYIQRRREYSKARRSEKIEAKTYGGSHFLKKWLVYSWLSTSRLVEAIQGERLMFLPESLRYRCYSLVIWGLADYFPERSIE